MNSKFYFSNITIRFKVFVRMELLHDEVHRYLARREEMESSVELPRSDTVLNDTLFHLCPTNHQSHDNFERL